MYLYWELDNSFPTFTLGFRILACPYVSQPNSFGMFIRLYDLGIMKIYNKNAYFPGKSCFCVCVVAHTLIFVFFTASLCSQYSWGFRFCKSSCGQHSLCIHWYSTCPTPNCFTGLATRTHTFFGRSFTSFKCHYHL